MTTEPKEEIKLAHQGGHSKVERTAMQRSCGRGRWWIPKLQKTEGQTVRKGEHCLTRDWRDGVELTPLTPLTECQGPAMGSGCILFSIHHGSQLGDISIPHPTPQGTSDNVW